MNEKLILFCKANTLAKYSDEMKSATESSIRRIVILSSIHLRRDPILYNIHNHYGITGDLFRS